MSGQGARKAAMLLMSLDPAAAGELLKSAKPDQVAQIAAELAFLRTTGAGKDQQAAVEEFMTILRGAAPSSDDADLRQIIEGALGKGKSQDMLKQVKALVQAKDPFVKLRQRDVKELAAALAGESGQVAALVLNELPPKKSSLLLALLDEKVRAAAVRGMANGADISPQAKLLVAEMMQLRLASMGESALVPADAKKDNQLRKVALSLRGLPTDIRDKLLKAINEQDAATGKQVQLLMVLWEDLPIIGDRVLQEVLRTVDAKKLALSVQGTDVTITTKIRDNISERASAMLDEEVSLLSSPKPAEIEAARTAILNSLRDLNNKGELTLVET